MEEENQNFKEDINKKSRLPFILLIISGLSAFLAAILTFLGNLSVLRFNPSSVSKLISSNSTLSSTITSIANTAANLRDGLILFISLTIIAGIIMFFVAFSLRKPINKKNYLLIFLIFFSSILVFLGELIALPLNSLSVILTYVYLVPTLSGSSFVSNFSGTITYFLILVYVVLGLVAGILDLKFISKYRN